MLWIFGHSVWSTSCSINANACVIQVEKAPIVVKSGLKKEEAEELMRKLEAGTFCA